MIRMKCVLCAAVLASAVFFPGCGAKTVNNSIQVTAENQAVSDLAREFFDNRTKLPGNYSALTSLINKLPFPKGLSQTNIQSDVNEKPYSLTVTYKTTDETDEVTDLMLFRNAALLFASVEDLDSVTFIGLSPDEASEAFSFSISRSGAEEAVGAMSLYNASADDMQRLIEYTTSEDFDMLFSSAGGSYIGGSAAELSGETFDLTHIDGALSYWILNENSNGYAGRECVSEGHAVLETAEENGELLVYSIVSYGEFSFENGIFTVTSGSGAIPTVILLKKTPGGIYVLEEYREPMDGSGYMESLKEMFPGKLLAAAQNAHDHMPALDAQKEAYAARYLARIGREAEIMSGHVMKTLADMNVEASNALLDMYWDYPYWIGTEEKIENGERFVYEKKWTDKGGGDGTVSFIKSKFGGGVVEKVVIEIKNGEMTYLEGTPRSSGKYPPGSE